MPLPRTEANALHICDRIAEGFTLREIANELGCAPSAVVGWANRDPEFAERYARALEVRMELYADEIIEIAEDSRNDWVTRQDKGQEYQALNDEHIKRTQLRIDARKWLMSKLAPKKYGERIQADLNVRVSWESLIQQAIEQRQQLEPPTIDPDPTEES